MTSHGDVCKAAVVGLYAERRKVYVNKQNVARHGENVGEGWVEDVILKMLDLLVLTYCFFSDQSCNFNLHLPPVGRIKGVMPQREPQIYKLIFRQCGGRVFYTYVFFSKGVGCGGI